MKKNMAILAVLSLLLSAILPTMADLGTNPDDKPLVTQTKALSATDAAKPAAKKEAKPDSVKTKKPTTIDTEAELETDCNSQ